MTKTQIEAAPPESSTTELPSYTFTPFNWTSDSVPGNTNVPAHKLCGLVDHVMDVVNGAALVFELMSAHDCDIDSDNQSYLNPYHLGLLRRMAVRSLESLGERADDISTYLKHLELDPVQGRA